MIEKSPLNQYHQQIQAKIEALNSLKGTEILHKTRQILKQLKMIDMQYLKQTDFQSIGQILFTRHGKCHIWYQKRFGLNPNSSLASQAIEAMSITKKLTQGLIVFNEKPVQVWVSPMIRAKQTAMLILPQNIKANIQYDIILSENSSKPSSSFITSNGQLQRQYQASSISDSFKKVLTYKLSNIFYGEEQTFIRMKELSEEIDKHLIAKSVKEIYFLSKNPENQRQKQIAQYTAEIKLKKLQEIIIKTFSHDEKRDLWFVGHSKNLKKFFKSVMHNHHRFEFGQTRRVYQIKSLKDKATYYFNPPYFLVIDQEDGSIRAKYVPDMMKIQKIMEKDLEHKPNSQKHTA